MSGSLQHWNERKKNIINYSIFERIIINVLNIGRKYMSKDSRGKYIVYIVSISLA